MKCARCGASTETKRATPRSPFHYTFSGLQNVYLCGITLHRCSGCHTVSPVIPRPAELNRVIADTIARKPSPLKGEEIRFLRKNLGIPAKELAAIFGIAPETLSRIENGAREGLKPGFEHVLRLMARTAVGGESPRDAVLKVVEEMTERTARRTQARPIKFAPDHRGGWKRAA